MLIRTRIVVGLISASMLYGQDAPAPVSASILPKQPGLEAVIIPVKTLTGDSFRRLTTLLKVFDARFTADEQLRTIVVYAPKDVVTQMRRVIDELDRPGSEAAVGRNIEMTITLLKCSTHASSGNQLPPEIESVAKQLRNATQYKDVQVWDVVPLRVQEGKVAQQVLQLSGAVDARNPPILHIDLIPDAVIRKGQQQSVRFSRLNFTLNIPIPNSHYEVALRTAGDLIEGQKTVLGKVSGSEEETAVFVVIALKVVD